MKKTTKQLIKFFISGTINTSIDFLVLNLLIFSFGIASPFNYLAFKAVSFTAGTTNSFFLNKNWVFRKNSNVRKEKEEAFLFFAVASIGLLLNTLVATTIFSLSETYLAEVPLIFIANLGAVGGLGFVATWNFLGYKYIVFKR